MSCLRAKFGFSARLSCFEWNIGRLGIWVRSYGFVFKVLKKRGIISS